MQLGVSVGTKKSAASGAGGLASQFIPEFQPTGDVHCGVFSLGFSYTVISLQGKKLKRGSGAN